MPEADEFCFYGDYVINDEDEEAIVLPSGRKRKTEKMKDRRWFNESMTDAHEQLGNKLCFHNP